LVWSLITYSECLGTHLYGLVLKRLENPDKYVASILYSIILIGTVNTAKVDKSGFE
jgi:hypothetical protein